MKTLTLKRIVDSIVNRPSFQKAWKDIGEAGCGSVPAVRKIHHLITSSDWHRNAIYDFSKTILRLAADWADKELTEEHLQDFHTQLVTELSTIASAYTIIGITLGVTTLAYDHAKDQKQRESTNTNGTQ